MDPQEPIIHEPVVDVPPPPHRFNMVFQPPERYMGIFMEKVEKIFFMGDKGHNDDLNTFDEVMSDINFKK